MLSANSFFAFTDRMEGQAVEFKRYPVLGLNRHEAELQRDKSVPEKMNVNGIPVTGLRLS